MMIEADSGAMGGSQSEEFMVRTPAGEDRIVSCDKCNYAANMEKASSKLEPVEDLQAEGDGQPLEVHTPGQKTIEDVARFLGVSPKNKVKRLALMIDQHSTSTGGRPSASLSASARASKSHAGACAVGGSTRRDQHLTDANLS